MSEAGPSVGRLTYAGRTLLSQRWRAIRLQTHEVKNSDREALAVCIVLCQQQSSPGSSKKSRDPSVYSDDACDTS